MFGKEKYSREEYEKAEEEARSNFGRDLVAARSIDELQTQGLIDERSVHEAVRRKVEREARIKGKLIELKGLGETEAAELNDEYDKLKQRASEALSALRNFERDKLGVKDEVIGASGKETEGGD